MAARRRRALVAAAVLGALGPDQTGVGGGSTGTTADATGARINAGGGG